MTAHASLDLLEMFLTLLSGISWSIVYVELIRAGFKGKTYGMPLYALALNFAWELIYSCNHFVFPTKEGMSTLDIIQNFVNFIWMCLDSVILFTYFKYGKERYSESKKKYFISWSVLSIVTAFVVQIAILLEFDHHLQSAEYSAFAQNALMSILFVEMLFDREDTRGQNLIVAVSKCIGTLAPTILMGVLWKISVYILAMGGISFVFDVIYIYLLNDKIRKKEKNGKTKAKNEKEEKEKEVE